MDALLHIYEGHGSTAYFGEAVTVAEHGLQAAHFAKAAGAGDELIAAALLHDVGHLIGSAPADIADWTDDARHELVGSRWLNRYFGPGVSEPVRLHVSAKRYLCATAPDYLKALSPASVVTLSLQGGPMASAELRAFEAEACFLDAVRLRRWDDEAKIPCLPTPAFADYRILIEALAAERR